MVRRGLAMSPFCVCWLGFVALVHFSGQEVLSLSVAFGKVRDPLLESVLAVPLAQHVV